MCTPVKVLHVIPAIAPCYGGPSQAIYDMCRALSLTGCEVQIATTDADGKNCLAIELERLQSYNGVPTIFFHRQWSERFGFSLSLARWLAGNVQDFDVVHIHAVFSHACLAAARACHNKRVPYIIRTIGNLDPWSLGQKRFRKKLFWHLAVRQMLQRAAAIHYTALDEQRLVESTLRLQRGIAIPLGVDEDLLSAKPRENVFLNNYPALQQSSYVLTLCRLHPKKNLEALIMAFLKLPLEFQTWKLVIAGEGDANYVEKLKRLARQQGSADRILFTGWLQGEEKRGALCGAKLFALPSYQENFGLSVVEAMACDTPVLISEHVNLAADVAEVGAGWVVKLDSVALEEALRDALSNEGTRIIKSNAARKLVGARFTWPVVAGELLQLYQNVVINA